MKVELVTTLKRQATQILKGLGEDREPILITEHGIPKAYLVDAEDFENQKERIKLLEGLARGERAYQEGRVISSGDAKKNGRIRISRPWSVG